MASISTSGDGRRRILFNDSHGERKAIHLGKVSMRSAEGVLFRVEELLERSLLRRPMHPDLAQWVADLDGRMAKKLAAVGLIDAPAEPHAPKTTTLGPFLREYLDGRADLKPATRVVRGQVVSDLTAFLGSDCDVRRIGAKQADGFKQWLVKRGLASSTVSKRLQVARSLFHVMRRWKLIEANPFEGVQLKETGIQDRQRFVTAEEIELVMAHCPDHHWRTIVALSRWGGLRCPSEVLSLRWSDIDWERERIIVQSPKTETCGKATRVIPLFAELRPYLDEAWELAPKKGAVYVVDERLRKAAQGQNGWLNANLRTTFTKIVRRAGLQPWPRLFHNLRASRETELVSRFPIQVVVGWLGNTLKVAAKHYLMVEQRHFEQAAARGEKTTQKTTQQAHEMTRSDAQGVLAAHEKTLEFPSLAENPGFSKVRQVAGTGFEPATSRL